MNRTSTGIPQGFGNRGCIGLRGFSGVGVWGLSTRQNQIEKQTETEMETGIIDGYAGFTVDGGNLAPLRALKLLFHHPNITPIYYSSFHFLFHYPNITPIYYSSFHFPGTLGIKGGVGFHASTV